MFFLNESDQMLSSENDEPAEITARESMVNRIQKKRTAGDLDLKYFLFTAAQPKEKLPLFIVVHGIGRRAFDQARLFAPFIDAIGGTLIAPLFNKQRFRGYQQLGNSGKGFRSDLALQRLIAEVCAFLQRPPGPLVMFGYSGGGQFVHRYAMAYPRQVKRMAIAAAGWFTFPQMDLRFPFGTSQSTALPDLNFDASRFLKIPTLVLVGEKDVVRDKAFNRQKEINRQQGRNRHERASRWVNAMRAAAKRYRYETHYKLYTVPGCGHSFRECMTIGQMGRKIVGFLFDKDPLQQFKSGKNTSNLVYVPNSNGGIIC